MLHHVFGATSVAISTVLTVFMAGLGLGAWLGGKYAHRIKHPIITYAIAEIGVGVWGLLVPLLVRSDGWLATVNMFLRAELGAESGLFMVARFLCVAPILIVPTTLMGSTLPLLTRHFVATDHGAEEASTAVGGLYALNTFGASTGPLLSAFVLLPYVGLTVTNIVACSMNFTLAAIIFLARSSLLEGTWKPGEALSFLPRPEPNKTILGPPKAKVPEPEPVEDPIEEEDEDASEADASSEDPDAQAESQEIAKASSETEDSPGEASTTDGPSLDRPIEAEASDADSTDTPVRNKELRESKAERRARRKAKKGKRKDDDGAVAAAPSAAETGDAKVEAEPKPAPTLDDVPSRRTPARRPGRSFGKRRAPSRTTAKSTTEPTRTADAPIPELARKAAYICFAASGAAALCYEVVWSRGLAMTIGSSIYSFALILDTFLIGIAVGSAAMASFLGRRTTPFLGMGLTAIALVFLANIPWAIDIVDPTNTASRTQGSIVSYLVLSSLYSAPIVLAVVWVATRTRKGVNDVFSAGPEGWRPVLAVLIAALPTCAALINSFKYPGMLVQIILAVVGSVSVFIVLASLLSRTPLLLVAVIQLFIAGATLVSYIYMDDVPYAFAQLVVSIPDSSLPDHTATVKVFMFVTIMLCTLPSTLGMGAMFPLVVRVWTSGGDAIAKDVASVYTGNTIGSIIGAWLPGFILFALVGAERTLHLGIALNMVLALVMLIAGAADPHEEQSWWTWRRVGSVALPALVALALVVSLLTDSSRDLAFRWVSGALADESQRYQAMLWLVRLGGMVVFGAIAIGEYVWQRAATRASAEAALGAALLPLVGAAGIAFFIRPPGDHPDWALAATYVALAAFALGVGAWIAVGNWRAWADAHPAAIGEAQHG